MSDDGVAVVAFGDAGRTTFLTEALASELADGFAALRGDPGVRCIVLAGRGRAFAAGADLAPLERGVEDAMAFNKRLIGLCDMVAAFPVPVVAAINGMAFGGGLELALACTVRVASAGAALGFPEVKVGLVPGSGGMVRLPAVLGSPGRAAELVLTGRTVAAAEALSMGLVDAVADDAVARAHEIASQIAAAAPLAVRAALDLLRAAPVTSADVEARLAPLMGSADRAEGFAAFRERRAPRFEGR